MDGSLRGGPYDAIDDARPHAHGHRMAHALQDHQFGTWDILRGVDTCRQWDQWILVAVDHERRSGHAAKCFSSAAGR